MQNKGHSRSNARISDKDINRILSKKGKLKTFEIEHTPFSAGKSKIKGNKERVFLVEVE